MSVLFSLRALSDPAADGLPKPVDKARYDRLRTHSPFSLATAPAATPPPQAAFAANWFVAGVGRIGDTDFVSVKSRDLATAFTLFGNEPDATGVTLTSVNWSDALGKTTVILKKGAETAKLEFNEAELRAKPAAAAPGVNPAANGPPRPGTPPGAAPMPNPQVAAVPNQGVHRRMVIQPPH